MLPPSLASRLSLPVIAAPMFLVSTPALVIETCRCGVLGTFPTLNARSPQMLDDWLNLIKRELAPASPRAAGATAAAPFGVNLIVHHTNKQLKPHLEAVVKHRVPLVITSLGANKEVIDAVHSYKGLVFHDVTNVVHAEKAVAAGVDGLIAVCVGAGGHAGHASPMALVPQLRRRFPKIAIVLGGAIGDGAAVRAAQTLGADLAYLGTRFIATKESAADEGYKAMLVDAKHFARKQPHTFLPTVYTDRISGVYANFLSDSLMKAGLDPAKLMKMEPVKEDFSKLDGEQSAWSKIWSAGHGSLNIDDIPSTRELVRRLTVEYRAAVERETKELAQWSNRAKL